MSAEGGFFKKLLNRQGTPQTPERSEAVPAAQSVAEQVINTVNAAVEAGDTNSGFNVADTGRLHIDKDKVRALAETLAPAAGTTADEVMKRIGDAHGVGGTEQYDTRRLSLINPK